MSDGRFAISDCPSRSAESRAPSCARGQTRLSSRVASPGIAEHAPDSLYQVARVKWFRDVILGAEREPADDIGLVSEIYFSASESNRAIVNSAEGIISRT
jgi:hypothetical protein